MFMLKEEYLQQLLKDLYEKEMLDVYDYAAGLLTILGNEFIHTKSWSDQLIKDKLAKYTDETHIALEITNFGKYWVLKGGYDIFLKDCHISKDRQREKDILKEKEELLEARLRLTHYRLMGCWLTIVLSSLGFILSLYNLFLIMSGKK
jgi:hypothetical protein